jgi:hypothetical protein
VCTIRDHSCWCIVISSCNWSSALFCIIRICIAVLTHCAIVTMEKLSEAKRGEVKKMSDARLISKLLRFGMSEEEVEKMKRDELMNAWAEMILAGMEKKEVTKGYESGLERERFEFEKMKHEELMKRDDIDRAMRKKEIELREIQIRKDEEREEYRRKMDELQMKRLDEDRKRKDALVHQLKLFGDAMKGSAFNMTDDPLDLVPFFKHIEQLFDELGTTEELKVKLLRPYLNERAKMLVARVDPDKSNDFKFIKDYLLREFQLSPKVYLERFNTVVKPADETYMLFASKLKGLFDFYTASRKVDDFDHLVSLLVADRLKQSFSDTCLRHVLTVEASAKDGWLDYVKLAEVADTFQANQTNLRVGQVGCSGPAGGGQSKPKPQINYVPQKPTVNRSSSVPGANAQSGTIASVRTCYKCKSPDHLMRDCPKRNAGRVMTPPSDRVQNKPRYNAKANCTAIAVDPVAVGHVTQEVTLKTDNAQVKNDIAVVNRCVTDFIQSNDVLYVDHKVASSDSSRSNECLFDPAYVNVVSAAKDVINDADHLNDFCINDLSPLHYIEVNVEGIDGKMYALEDGGTEIAVIKASCLPINHYDVVGTVKLRGIVGVPVTANVVKLRISLADDVDNSLTVICAVCDEANEDLILPSNVVERLYKLLHDKMKDDLIDNRCSDECNPDRVDCCNVVHDKVNVANGSITDIDDGFTSTSGSDDSVTRVNSNESDVDKLITRAA